MSSSCAREVSVWILGKTPKEWLGTAMGFPGRWLTHVPGGVQ